MNNQKKPMERIEEYIQGVGDDGGDPDKPESPTSDRTQSLRTCVREWLEDYALACRRIKEPGSVDGDSGD